MKERLHRHVIDLKQKVVNNLKENFVGLPEQEARACFKHKPECRQPELKI